MSDTPEIGIGDEILDDQIDSIHLVYLHGSIHRRSQAASDADIRALKEKNAQTLAPVLKRHGVIVLGYSGWDDAMVEALDECADFDHLLYWCGREPDPLAKGAFGPRVPDILRKPTAFYVQIKSAGHFMARLYSQLVEGPPRLLLNPIGQIRELLTTIDLKELRSIAAQASSNSDGPQPLPNADSFVAAQGATIERLIQAERLFLNSPAVSAAAEPVSTDSEASAASSPSSGNYLLSSAGVATSLGKHTDSIRYYTEFLAFGSIPVDQQAEALLGRATAFYFSNQLDEAQADLTQLIERLPGAPVELLARALYNRGFAWGVKGETDKELADYTRLIERLPGAPVEGVAKALVNRGLTWRAKGETDKELADYTWAIEQLLGAPAESVAVALVSRGNAWLARGETDRALADYTRVIEQLPGAPSEAVAGAFAGRGWAHYMRKEYPAFLADTQAALEKVPTIGFGAFSLGLAFLVCGDDQRALAAYEHAAKEFPDKSNPRACRIWRRRRETGSHQNGRNRLSIY